jgi:vang-like
VSVASKGRSHNDRFHEEFEHDRKVKKRRARLIAATEEAFTHIKRMRENQPARDNKPPMEPYEAAQAIFPTLSRPLQKYLRSTRQQPRHTMESILQHLSNCLSYDMSPRAFLEKYLITSPVLQNDREVREIQHWSLVSERSLYRDIQPGSLFQLRQAGDVSLLCQVEKLPHFNLSEEIIEPSSNRFVLKINSETSV